MGRHCPAVSEATGANARAAIEEVEDAAVAGGATVVVPIVVGEVAVDTELGASTAWPPPR
jgi:hypothetical protein